MRCVRRRQAESAGSLEPILDVMRHRTGLTLPERTVPIATVRSEMRKAGAINVAEYSRLLAADSTLFGALVTALTVGETYFFREREQLAFISRAVLPELVRESGGKRLAAWSAGCAQGEEAYSLAIIGQSADCALQVLGTDISRARLEHARAGVYREWSFRGVSPEIRDRYFKPVQSGFEILPEVRSNVEFRVLNLAAADWSAADQLGPFDLVLCRNTLIYLDGPTVVAVARRLMASLAPYGWLFLGASDPLLSGMVPCEVVLTGAGVAYRRPRRELPRREGAGPARLRRVHAAPPPVGPDPVRAAPRRRKEDVAPAPAPPFPSPATARSDGAAASDAKTAYARGDYRLAVERARGRVEVDPGDADEWILLVRALANLGRLDEAGSACAAGHDLHRNSAELSYLHGLLLREGGRIEDALAALRSAVYLDRRLVIAHLTLGDVLASQGDTTGAMRAFRNADRLLARVPEDAVVAATDGMQARTLRQLTRGRMDYWQQRSGAAEPADV
jgi:chemotaxis protein methyltransferase CheR